MNFQSSFLVAGSYVLLAAVVGLATYALFSQQPDESQVAQNLNPYEPRSASRPVRRTTPVLAGTNDSYVESLRRIDELQDSLSRQSALLEKKNSLLREREAAYASLKLEFDEYTSLVGDWMAEQSGDSEPPAANDAAPDAVDELASLRARLSQSTQSEEELQLELAEVREQLATTDAELERVRLEADADIATLLQLRGQIDVAATQVLREAGQAAVAPLTALLEHPSADVRGWAAQALGEIGPPAGDAIPALLAATSDSNQLVRSSARLALRRIRD